MTGQNEASAALTVGVLFLALGLAYADAARSPENQHAPGRFMTWWTQTVLGLRGRPFDIYIRAFAILFLIGAAVFLARSAALFVR